MGPPRWVSRTDAESQFPRPPPSLFEACPRTGGYRIAKAAAAGLVGTSADSACGIKTASPVPPRPGTPVSHLMPVNRVELHVGLPGKDKAGGAISRSNHPGILPLAHETDPSGLPADRCRPPASHGLVRTERFRNAGRLLHEFGQACRVLNRHAGALANIRGDGVGSIAQQRHTALPPTANRPAVPGVGSNDIARIGGLQQGLDWRVPGSEKIDQRLLAVVPRVRAALRAVLRGVPANPPLSHRHYPKTHAGAPAFADVPADHACDHRSDAPPNAVAAIDRTGGSVQLRPDGGIYAVRTDESVRADNQAACEPGRDPARIFHKRNQSLIRLLARAGQRLAQGSVQVGPVDAERGRWKSPHGDIGNGRAIVP